MEPYFAAVEARQERGWQHPTLSQLQTGTEAAAAAAAVAAAAAMETLPKLVKAAPALSKEVAAELDVATWWKVQEAMHAAQRKSGRGQCMSATLPAASTLPRSERSRYSLKQEAASAAAVASVAADSRTRRRFPAGGPCFTQGFGSHFAGESKGSLTSLGLTSSEAGTAMHEPEPVSGTCMEARTSVISAPLIEDLARNAISNSTDTDDTSESALLGATLVEEEIEEDVEERVVDLDVQPVLFGIPWPTKLLVEQQPPGPHKRRGQPAAEDRHAIVSDQAASTAALMAVRAQLSARMAQQRLDHRGCTTSVADFSDDENAYLPGQPLVSEMLSHTAPGFVGEFEWRAAVVAAAAVAAASVTISPQRFPSKGLGEHRRRSSPRQSSSSVPAAAAPATHPPAVFAMSQAALSSASCRAPRAPAPLPSLEMHGWRPSAFAEECCRSSGALPSVQQGFVPHAARSTSVPSVSSETPGKLPQLKRRKDGGAGALGPLRKTMGSFVSCIQRACSMPHLRGASKQQASMATPPPARQVEVRRRNQSRVAPTLS